MIQTEFDAIWNRLQEAIKDGDESLKDKSEEELREEYMAIAQRRVRLGLLLADVGRKNHLKINQDELSRAVMDHARMFPGQEAKIFEFYQQHPQQLEELKGPILEDKAVDFLVEKADVKSKTVTIEELLADDEEEGDSKAKKKPAAKKKAASKKADQDEKAEKSDDKAAKAKKAAPKKKSA
jgi:trigger factor